MDPNCANLLNAFLDSTLYTLDTSNINAVLGTKNINSVLDTDRVNGVLEVVLCFVTAGSKGSKGEAGERGQGGRHGLKGDRGDRGFPGQKGKKSGLLTAFKQNHTTNNGNVTDSKLQGV